MDNGTHTLLGAALSKSRLGRLHRLAPLSLVLAANLPDADIVATLFGGKDSYLFHHRGVTHSLFGIVLQVPLFAWLMKWIERRSAERLARAAPPFVAAAAPVAPAGFAPYLWPALVGLLSHPLLDSLNNYGVRPWLPFSDARYFGDLVFIVDPWLWLLFGGVALLAGARTRLGSVGWGVVAAAASLVVYVNRRSPAHLEWIWPFAVATLALLRVTRVGVARPGRALACGALLLVSYLGALEWGARTAVMNALTRAPGTALSTVRRRGDTSEPRFVMRSPTVADPFHWTLCFRVGDVLRWRSVGIDGSPAPYWKNFSEDIPSNFDDPDVVRAAHLSEAAGWRHFVRVPSAWKETRDDGSVHVFLSDARYQWARGPGWCVVEVVLPKGEGGADAGRTR